MNNSFKVTYLVRERNRRLVRRLPFLEMKETVLGKKYDLSLVFIGETRSRTLTTQYRKKDKVSNVLSFPIDAQTGEIFITPEVARREAALFGKTPQKHIGFLFIHGLLHLKGYHHGSRMENKEKALSRRFCL